MARVTHHDVTAALGENERLKLESAYGLGAQLIRSVSRGASGDTVRYLVTNANAVLRTFDSFENWDDGSYLAA